MCPLFIGLSYHFCSVYNNIPQLLQYIPGIFSYSSSIAGVFLPFRHLVPGLHDQSAHRASGFSDGLLDLRRTSPPRLASVSGDEPSGLRLWERQIRVPGPPIFCLGLRLVWRRTCRSACTATARDRRCPDRVSAPLGGYHAGRSAQPTSAFMRLPAQTQTVLAFD